MSLIDDVIKAVKPVDKGLKKEMEAHLDNLTKPPKSLGQLEQIAIRYGLARGTAQPKIEKKKIFTFAGDHGVSEEGVSAYPKAVTPQMVRNMVKGGAAINVLARHAGVDHDVIDVGVDDSLEGLPGLTHRKIRRGTANFVKGPALTADENQQALTVGIHLGQQAAQQGYALIGTGEMGIGNTTAASALFAALLPCDVDSITGRGTGIDDQTLRLKKKVIKQALQTNKRSLSDPIATLAALGGLEISALCGLILGSASCRLPVVVDGFISSSAALAALKICPPVKDYLFFSHLSAEAGHAVFMKAMGERPILDLDLRLGEGTGAALAILIIEGAIKIFNEMATFDSARVSHAVSTP